MKRIFQKRTLPIVLAAGIILFLVWQLSNLLVSADPLSEADASRLVKDMYGGAIEAIKKENGRYQISIQSKDGKYDIAVDQNSGEILGVEKIDNESNEPHLTETEVEKRIREQYPGEMEQLDKKVEDGRSYYFAVVREGTAETQLKIDPVSGEIVSSNKKETNTPEGSAKGISEKEAVEIALNRVKGEVDDVDLEESDGLYYYLIEVEVDNGKEATVQINAITGEILSTTWDD